MLQYLFAAFMVLVAFAWVALSGYWVFVDTKAPVVPVSIRVTNEFGVPTKTFHPGDAIRVQRENCATRDALVQITREIVRVSDQESFTMPSGPYAIEEGCRISINTIIIPSYLSPGMYEYRVRMSWQNNPLAWGTTRLQAFQFTVVP